MPKGTILQLQSTTGQQRGKVRLEVANDGNLTFTSEKSTNDGGSYSDASTTSSIKFGNTEIKKNSVVMATAGTISINDCVISVDDATGAIQTKKGTGGALKKYADETATANSINTLTSGLGTANTNITALTTDLSTEKGKIVTLETKVNGLTANGGTGELLDQGTGELKIHSKAGTTELKLANIDGDNTVAADSVFARFYNTAKVGGDYAEKGAAGENGIDIQVTTLSLLDVLKYAASIEKQLRLLREAQFPENPA